jgi:glutaconate CoA-transferase, subunit B
VIIMTHEQRRFRERVQYLTSVGHGTEKGWRQRVGLSGGGPSRVVTSLGVFSFDDSGEMILASLHPGISREAVQENTGWTLRSASIVAETQAPTAHELLLIRQFDTLG